MSSFNRKYPFSSNLIFDSQKWAAMKFYENEFTDSFTVSAENPSLTNPTEEVISTSGGSYNAAALQLFGTAISGLEILSSSANDTAAGTGARTVKITGIATNGTIGSKTVTLNGTTAVAVGGSYCFITRIEVMTVGSGLKNAGTLTLRDGTAKTVLTLGAELVDTRSSFICCGTGAFQRGVITNIQTGTSGTRSDKFFLNFVNLTTTGNADERREYKHTVFRIGSEPTGKAGIYIPPMTFVYMTGISAAGTVALCGSMEVVITGNQ